jgi:hypothetical protein
VCSGDARAGGEEWVFVAVWGRRSEGIAGDWSIRGRVMGGWSCREEVGGYRRW